MREDLAERSRLHLVDTRHRSFLSVPFPTGRLIRIISSPTGKPFVLSRQPMSRDAQERLTAAPTWRGEVSFLRPQHPSRGEADLPDNPAPVVILLDLGLETMSADLLRVEQDDDGRWVLPGDGLGLRNRCGRRE